MEYTKNASLKIYRQRFKKENFNVTYTALTVAMGLVKSA